MKMGYTGKNGETFAKKYSYVDNIMMTFLKWIALAGITLGLIGYAVVRFHPVWGGKPDEVSLARIKQSKAYDGGKFNNLEPTELLTGTEKQSMLKAMWQFIYSPKGKNPSEPLPTVALDKRQLSNGSAVWLGHSTTLFQTAGKLFMTDPVFYHASPIPFTVQPFKMTHRPTIDELPEIDAVLISHDHYDHLDYYAIREIDTKTRHFFVPLGVKAHLQRWGIADSKITELDWHGQAHLDDTVITFVPARHFSGRKLGEQDSTLWGGYVVKSPDISLYFSADSGYGKHFTDSIAKYAPFDFVMIENGAYDDRWSLIHETPEEAVAAVSDVNATKALPIHWGKFDLAEHQWKEPVERFIRAAAERNLDIATPKIGQVFYMKGELPKERWWESVK